MPYSKADRWNGLNATIKAMVNAKTPQKENGFTLGWDVVVSYAEKEINEFLKSKYNKASSGIIKNIEAQSKSFNPDTFMHVTFLHTVALGPPMIRFSGRATTGPAVELLMPVLSGSMQKVNRAGQTYGNKAELIENAYLIRLSGIPLGTVKGKYGTIRHTNPSTPNQLSILNAGSTCVFRNDRSNPTVDDFEVAWIVLDFLTGDIRNKINLDLELLLPIANTDEYEQAAALKTELEAGMKAYFVAPTTKIDVIEYALATVKNKPSSNERTTTDLTPVSFQLATFHSDYQAEPILSLFIHTVSGTDSGRRNDLQTGWQNQWIDHNTSPIPLGYTASILINPNVVFHNMLKPGMEKGGEWKVDDRRLTDKTGGVAISAKKQNPWVMQTQLISYKDMYRDYEFDYGGFTKDLKDDPMKIHIYQKATDGAPEAHIDWTFSVQNTWMDRTSEPKWWSGSEQASFGKKNMRSTYTMDADYSIYTTASNYDISFEIFTGMMDKNWAIKDEETGLTGNAAEKFIQGLANLIASDPPPHLMTARRNALQSMSPRPKLDTGGLGFFLTTNLLNPGAKVIEIDKDVGMRLPKDMVLVGDIVQGVDIVKQAQG